MKIRCWCSNCDLVLSEPALLHQGLIPISAALFAGYHFHPCNLKLPIFVGSGDVSKHSNESQGDSEGDTTRGPKGHQVGFLFHITKSLDSVFPIDANNHLCHLHLPYQLF